MDLFIKEQLFVVGGASSGFGKAITKSLISEGSSVIAIARGEEKMKALKVAYPDQVEIAICDITRPESTDLIKKLVGGRPISGIVLNAGGPPAMSAMEAKPDDWDRAYESLLRWKVSLLHALVPSMIEKKYGRIVFIESASVKQPIENLVLSNALRLAVVGYAKTLSQEISHHGVTVNVLAPSYHDTAAMERVIRKKQDITGITKEEATRQAIAQTSVGFVGNTADFASLTTWLMSPHSRYITGQTISVDGGVIKGIMG